MTGKPTTLTLAHSPDADDAFMFQPLLQEQESMAALRFRSVLKDIETLNRMAEAGRYDVTALSLHGYPFVSDRYRPLLAGASVGDGYGPVVVSRKRLTSLAGLRVAIPGERTTAALLLRLWERRCRPVPMRFDRIPQAVRSGAVAAGVLIHEAQIAYQESNLQAIVDLGAWWKQRTGLPVVLGIVAVRRTLPEETQRRVAESVFRSVRAALARRAPALAAARRYARGMGPRRLAKFVAMYVNRFTLDLGPSGRAGAALLLRVAAREGLIPRVRADWLGAHPRGGWSPADSFSALPVGDSPGRSRPRERDPMSAIGAKFQCRGKHHL